MTEPKKVRGLLEALEAETSGQEWELDSPSPEYVPGMGLGATKEATRWAWQGMQLEVSKAIEADLKRPANRPRKDPLKKDDAKRAFEAWRMCWTIRKEIGEPRAKITNRELIRLVQLFEENIGIEGHDQIFSASDTSNQESLSRGKKLLKIDGNWNSDVCEKLSKSFTQTT